MEPGVQTWEAGWTSELGTRSGRNMMSGWDGLIRKSWGRMANAQGKMHTLNSYRELS